MRTLLVLVSLVSLVAPYSSAVEPTPPVKPAADGSDAARKQMAAFRLPPGLVAELFAAEPALANPVAVSVDDRGRVYAAETHRLGRGAVENRDNPAMKTGYLLPDDLRSRTPADRLAMLRKWQHRFPGGFDWFTRAGEQVRRLEDADGDGRADRSTVFAGGFDGPLDGLAAGVLAADGDVYLTCIPSLWRLRDADGDGAAEAREPLLTGFGVQAAFYGHDLHGLIRGPDGKLYFSVGDRGFHVESKEGTTFSGPRTGAVFRCDPDGRNFEVVMRGLRNPQELAFDQYGNLFAGDNNCDKGDHARLVYVVEGGDAGWDMAYQSIPAPYTAGPWFAERLWHLPHAGQPAWVVPPVGKIGTGPSGLLFTSGTTLPDRYRNSFLLCNYAGGRGLEAFRVVPKGAGFEVADYHDFLTPVMATDAEFGPDGRLYVSDFVTLDWSGEKPHGRIYTVSDPAKVMSPAAAEVKRLFAEGFGKRSTEELVRLLGHADQKVRLRAQFALAGQMRWEIDHAINGTADLKVSPLKLVSRTAAKAENQLARIHAMWAIGQVGTVPIPGLTDADAEIRAQAAKLSAGAKNPGQVIPHLLRMLSDDGSGRVKFFAAQSLGKLKHAPAVPALFRVLAENNDADPFLRHACVAALANIGDADAVAARAADPSPSVRLAVVLSQRRMNDNRVSRFLSDADPAVRVEAARAVHDLPLSDQYPALAEQLATPGNGPDADALARRAIDAHFVLGGPANAKAVLAAAGDKTLSPAVRAEAVAALREWADPPQRDRVTGVWRPLPRRDPAGVRAVVEAGFEKLLASADGPLLRDAVGLVGPLGLNVDPDVLLAWAADPGRDAGLRTAAVRVLADRKLKGAGDAVLLGLRDADPAVRAEVREVLAASDPATASVLLAAVAADAAAAVPERQRSVAALAKLKTPAAGAALDVLAGQLAAGVCPPELRLDAWEALKTAPTPGRDRHRAAFEATLPPGPHGRFAVALAGGDAARGREVFQAHAAAQCARCHAVNGVGGTAGPDLSHVASRSGDRPRDHFLESLLAPNAKIAPGYAAVTLSLADGRAVAGTLLSEDKTAVTIQTPDGKKETIPVTDIDARTAASSAMPEMGKTLTPREARDLIEFLGTLK